MGQQPVVELRHLCPQCLQCRKRFLASLQKDNALDGIIVLVDTDATEARLESFMDVAQILQENRNIVSLGYDDVFHFLNGLQQRDAADVDILTSESEVVAARIRIAGGNG